MKVAGILIKCDRSGVWKIENPISFARVSDGWLSSHELSDLLFFFECSTVL